MSTTAEAQAWAWRQVMPKGPDGIPATGKFLLAAIAQETHRVDGGPYRAEPGMAKLVTMTGLNESTIIRLIRQLKDGGFLERERGKPDERGRRSRDVFTLPVSIVTSTAKPASRSKVAPRIDGSIQAGTIQVGTAPPMQDGPNRDEFDSQTCTAQEQVLSTSSNDEVLLERPELRALCQRLADLIVANGSKRPRITKKWLDETRRLIDLDKRTIEQIEKAIDWSQEDSFWRTNILSMETLRKQYDKMRLDAIRKEQAKAPRNFLAEREQQVQEKVTARQSDRLSSAR